MVKALTCLRRWGAQAVDREEVARAAGAGGVGVAAHIVEEGLLTERADRWRRGGLLDHVVTDGDGGVVAFLCN